jgi:hypothetical protein
MRRCGPWPARGEEDARALVARRRPRRRAPSSLITRGRATRSGTPPTSRCERAAACRTFAASAFIRCSAGSSSGSSSVAIATASRSFTTRSSRTICTSSWKRRTRARCAPVLAAERGPPRPRLRAAERAQARVRSARPIHRSPHDGEMLRRLDHGRRAFLRWSARRSMRPALLRLRPGAPHAPHRSMRGASTIGGQITPDDRAIRASCEAAGASRLSRRRTRMIGK